MHLGSGRPEPPAVGAAPAPVEDVLIVGDSLEIGSSPYVREAIPGAAFTVSAEIGRPSGDALATLREELRPEHDVVVFDVGVNNDPGQPEGLAADLAAARELAGERCLVVATLSRPPLAGVTIDAMNDAVRAFAAQSAQTRLVEWRDAALANPGLLNPDGVHPTPAGYALRGRLVAQAVESCAVAGPSPAELAGAEAEAEAARERAAAGQRLRAETRRARRAAARARQRRQAFLAVVAEAEAALAGVGRWLAAEQADPVAPPAPY